MCKRILLLLAILFVPLAVRAQVGTTTDILTGRVTDTAGKPMANVEVVAQSGETGISRKKRTDNDGRYTILFPDGGGQYRLTVRAIGFEPVFRNVARQADEDRLITDVQFGKTMTTQLAPVNVSAGRGGGRNRGDRPSPGESGRSLNADQIARFPVDAGDLAAIASLAPGVIPIGGTDSTAAGFSVAGQRSTLNNVTLDGLSFGSFSVPQEGLRSTRVVTNTFDPSRGQFSGGLVASTTRSGTNELTGGFTYSRRDPTLEFPGNDSATAFSPLYLQDQISAGLGGPIIKDKLFVFGSAQFRRLSNPFQSLLAASPSALSSLGVQADSASQFINTVNGYGVPLNSSLVPARKIGDNTLGLLRLDYFVSDGTTLTLRGDYRRQSQDPTRSNPLALPTLSGTSTTTGGGVAAILTSAFQNGIINQFSSYLSKSSNHADPFLALPSGRVRVTSLLTGATQGISVLGFGGNPSLPQQGDDGLLELSDELSYLTHDRTHRIKLGGLLDVARFNQDLTNNRIGTFTFNSLQDFVDNVPASYTRTLGSQQVDGSTTSGAIYLGDTWQPRQGAQVVYGLRAEGTRVGNTPPFNPSIQQLFGLRTDEFPSEVHVSPRVGFSVNLTRPDTTDLFSQFLPPFLVRGGIGEFRAKTPTGLFTSAQEATGLANTEQQVVCIGPAVPVPDWTSYEADPTTIPTQCAQANSTPDLGAIQNNVTLFDPTFKAPRAWRSSLGVQRRLFGLITASADASYARGVALYGVTDLNLNTTPAFLLSNEGNRPVYVPPSAIVSTTGSVSPTASRKYQQYGDVLELSSNLKSDTRQLLLSLNGAATNGTIFNLSYTLSDTRDQSTFTCCSSVQGFMSPTTGGNPNVPGWAPGDLDTRHIFQATITKPVTSSLDLTGIARLSSGQPFTPLVGGDINGDGARNDRAFIFNPSNTTDPAVATAMQQLLANTSARVRDCLNEQMGMVAGRNSCRGPWTPSLDIQANFRPDGFGLHRKMMFSLITSNLLAGVDQLLHGSNLRGWGQPNRVDPTLLYVRGFDASTQSFIYDVNERFGSTNLAQSAYRVPFVVSLQARLMLGPDPRDRFRQIFSSRLQSATGGTGTVLNPIAQIIQMRLQLQLTQDQVDKLTVVSDSLAQETRVLSDSIRAIVAKQGGNADSRAIMSAIRPQIVEGRKNMAAALARAQEILSKEQWSEVPNSVKVPPRGLGGQGGGQGGGRRGGGRGS